MRPRIAIRWTVVPTIVSILLNAYFLSETVTLSSLAPSVDFDFVSQYSRLIHKNETIKGTNNYRRVHDNSSLTTFVWNRGVPLMDSSVIPPSSDSNFTIDAASMGCAKKQAWMQAQVDTWGSTIRYFFGATEADDADPTCNLDMTPAMVNQTALLCGRQRLGQNKLRMLAKGFFARPKWLAKSNKGVGWLCAQQRFASLLGKVGKFYQRQLAADSSFELPSFLLIQDDDTYYNMDKLESELLLKVKDLSAPSAAAGCIVHMPINMLNFSFPWGGYGTILSRGAVERLIRPIYCNGNLNITSKDTNHDFVALICDAVKEDLFGEKAAFLDGMSISDLMRAHATMNPFRDFQKWRRRPGYCFHGDWIMGYYLNFYVLAGSHSTSPGSGALPNFHMDSSLGYQYGTRKPLGNCRQQSTCSPTEYAACHRQTPESMALLNQQREIQS